jgi:hypothetical protein
MEEQETGEENDNVLCISFFVSILNLPLNPRRGKSLPIPVAFHGSLFPTGSLAVFQVRCLRFCMHPLRLVLNLLPIKINYRAYKSCFSSRHETTTEKANDWLKRRQIGGWISSEFVSGQHV